MALGSSDITIKDAKAEEVLPGTTDNLNSTTVGASSINPHSFWGPGGLSVDGNKDIVFTAVASDEKTGDFRLYNKTVSTPSGGPGLSHKWGPGGTDTDFTMVVFPQQLNVFSFAVSGAYLTTRFYGSTSDRVSEINLIKSQITLMTTFNPSLLTGHTRTPTSTNQVSHPQQILIENFPTTGLSEPDTIYIDAFISNVSGSRRINLPNKAGGYSNLNISEFQQPFMHAVGSLQASDLPGGNSPAGNPWSATGSRFQLFSAATPKDSSAPVTQTAFGMAYIFYWTIVLGDTFGNFYTAGVSSIDIRCYWDDGGTPTYDQLIETNTTNTDPTTQRQENGSVTGRNFTYDDEWVVYEVSGSITYNGVYSAI